jgi:hypothetical protein
LPPRRTRPAPSTSLVFLRARRLNLARGLAFFVALLVLLASLSAEAKKKKGGKKHKTPSSSTKSKSGGLPPPDESDSEDESDEKASSKKSAPEAGEAEPDEAAKKAPPPAPEPEDQPVKKAPKVAKAPAEAEAGAVTLVALQFGLGGKALFRTLAWSKDMGMLAPYSLSPGPEAMAWLEAYPAAFATDGFAANIGVFGSFDYGIGASSKAPGNVTLTTKYQDFLAGIKVRIPLGNIQPYVAGAFGQQKFHLEPADPSRPNFNYTVIHAGGGARVQFTPSIDADLGAGFLIVRDLGSLAGEVASSGLYPGATAYGFDATLSVGVRLASMVGVRLGADLRQMGVSLHWKSTDTGAKAGGAVDRYIGAWAGLEVVFDGLGGGSGESSSAPPPKAAPKAKKAEPEEGEPSGDSPAKEEKASDIE